VLPDFVLDLLFGLTRIYYYPAFGVILGQFKKTLPYPCMECERRVFKSSVTFNVYSASFSIIRGL